MYIIYAKISLVLDLFFIVEIICEVKVIPMQLGTSATIPCDIMQNDNEVRHVQWYKSRRNDVFENGDNSLAFWRDGRTGSQPNYQIENGTFSLIFFNSTFEDEGLYKCSVARGDLFIESDYFIRTTTYALPRTGPVMTVDDKLKHVQCTVDHVKPLIYPVVDFANDKAYNAVINADGTYTTSISCLLPQDRSGSRVECSFRYLHHHQIGSLHLPPITTKKPTSIKTEMSTSATSVTFTDGGYGASDSSVIIALSSVLVLTIVSLAMLILLIVHKKLRLAVTGMQVIRKENENMRDLA